MDKTTFEERDRPVIQAEVEVTFPVGEPEVSQAMIFAGEETFERLQDSFPTFQLVEAVYRAMALAGQKENLLATG